LRKDHGNEKRRVDRLLSSQTAVGGRRPTAAGDPFCKATIWVTAALQNLPVSFDRVMVVLFTKSAAVERHPPSMASAD